MLFYIHNFLNERLDLYAETSNAVNYHYDGYNGGANDCQRI